MHMASNMLELSGLHNICKFLIIFVPAYKMLLIMVQIYPHFEKSTFCNNLYKLCKLSH